MLGLKLATDPRWVELVESNISEVLTDHAFCEQKALSNAISIVVNYPEHTEIVQQLLEIAQEELQHFKQVHQIIVERGFTLGRERKDSYVNELMQFVRKGYNRDIVLMDRLLFSAMIEARSCERFKVLSQKINDPQLAEFYRELMISEAGHYTTFIKLAKKFFPETEVEERWKAFLEFEAAVIANYGKKETIHG
jgi:tRNA-(ms[2]io[6]A)-hydroxylase